MEDAVRRHPKAALYRVQTRQDHIAVHERLGPEADELVGILRDAGWSRAELRARLEQHLEDAARYTPVLRFHLLDARQRHFRVERRWYLGHDDDWLRLGVTGSIEEVTQQVVPVLGKEEFYELW